MKLKKMWRKVLTSVLTLGVLAGTVCTTAPTMEVQAAGNSQTVSAQMPFREMTAAEMVAEMGTGWNLGNTMDGHTGFTPGETIWQNVETTQELIKTIHDLGFNTIRIPVTWGTMIDDENGYAIDETWMSRVQDIVDYAVNMNMYAIINIHHDGAEQSGWFRIAADDLAPIKAKYAAVWKQIAERFKDYDEHVIFESMNEVTGSGTTVAEDTARIMQFNQIFVDTVRATGSNNTQRWLSVPGRYTNIVNTTDPKNGFALPADTVEGRIFVAVHYYDWQFGLLENMQVTTFVDQKVEALLEEFSRLEDTFTSKGIPVILGEYGAINKMNTADRTYHMEIVNRMCQQMGVVPVYWDQGWYDLSMEPDYSFTLVDRATCEEVYPEIISGIMRGMFLTGAEDLSDIPREIVVNPITDLGSVSGRLMLHMGEVKDLSLAQLVDKSASNDVVMWKSADETVATVNPDGSVTDAWVANIHATGIGNTVITAYSREGKAVLEIPVEVRAAETTVPCTSISAEKDSYTMTTGQSLYLNATMAPADTDAFLTYRSSDTDVITVSKIGKVVAKKSGSAYVIITSSDGRTLTVPVTVEEAEVKAQIALALNVYYNDSNCNYFSNEYGSAITVSEEGTYKLSFDCGKDLSDKATAAGVTGLMNLTAIYIKDDSVTRGLAKKSPLVSCDIIYDSVKIDGKDYTVHMDAPKSALKASGIFDTNDPINSWDGSVIEEVFVNNHVLNFTELKNPQTVEVTFTLSNLVFAEGAGEVATVHAESLEAAGAQVVTVDNSKAIEVAVQASPANCGKVTFVSSDASIVSVGGSGVTVGDDGTAKATLFAHGTGSATVTAITDNGLTVTFDVTADASKDDPAAELTVLASGVQGNSEGNSAQESEKTEESQQSTEESKVEEVPAQSSGQQEDQQAAGKAQKSKGLGTVQLVLIILGIVALGVAVFFVTLKVADGSPKKAPEEKQEDPKAAEDLKEEVEDPGKAEENPKETAETEES